MTGPLTTLQPGVYDREPRRTTRRLEHTLVSLRLTECVSIWPIYNNQANRYQSSPRLWEPSPSMVPFLPMVPPTQPLGRRDCGDHHQAWYPCCPWYSLLSHWLAGATPRRTVHNSKLERDCLPDPGISRIQTVLGVRCWSPCQISSPHPWLCYIWSP